MMPIDQKRFFVNNLAERTLQWNKKKQKKSWKSYLQRMGFVRK